MRYFNIQFRLPHSDECSYMLAHGTEQDIDDSVTSLRQAGFIVIKGDFYVAESC
jgi:hypothetical protein